MPQNLLFFKSILLAQVSPFDKTMAVIWTPLWLIAPLVGSKTLETWAPSSSPTHQAQFFSPSYFSMFLSLSHFRVQPPSGAHFSAPRTIAPVKMQQDALVFGSGANGTQQTSLSTRTYGLQLRQPLLLLQQSQLLVAPFCGNSGQPPRWWSPKRGWNVPSKLVLAVEIIVFRLPCIFCLFLKLVQIYLPHTSTGTESRGVSTQWSSRKKICMHRKIPN